MNDKKVEVTLDLMNRILQYLGSKPFVEVAALIEAIQKEAKEQVEGRSGEALAPQTPQ